MKERTLIGMKRSVQIKKIVVSFIISALIFSLTAILFSIAFSCGRSNRTGTDKNKNDQTVGNAFNLLLMISDYIPEKFDDYDPVYVKNVMGLSVSPPTKLPPSSIEGYRKVCVERMVIVRFDSNLGKLVFIPISGNTLVYVKGLRVKLGDVAGEWGISLLIEKIHALTGIKPDNFAVFSPQNAAKAIDLAGNIDYTVKCNMKQSVPERGLNVDITAGTYRFDGKTSVDLIRFDDYEKTGVERSEIISGYLKRLLSNLSDNFTKNELKNNIKSAFELSYTDFDKSKDKLDQMLLMRQLEMNYVELEGGWQTVDRERYFVPNETETLNKLFIYRAK